jgi:nitronate monooxygenase
MAGVQGSELTVAVCKAGGLGSLPCAMLSLEAMRAEMAAIKAQTARPFNANFFCHTPPLLSDEREAAWRARLAPYYKTWGIDADTIPVGPGRAPFSADTVDVLEQCKPAVVSFHFGLPSVDLLARVKACGAKILCSATTVAEARWLEARGVDAIIAQGLEAGGHRGIFLSEDLSTQVGTFALVRQIVQAVKLPVIAAGGIADAEGVAAAIALGAAAVQIGTAYLLCSETKTSALHRSALNSEAATHTAITNLFTGRPARSIVNRMVSELGPMGEAMPAFPLAAAAIAPLRAAAEKQGLGDFSSHWAGQNVSGCKRVPAAELTRELTAKL